MWACTSLEHIIIPNAVTTIQKWTFKHSLKLVAVTLNDDLDEIGEKAYVSCKSLQHVFIPPAVKVIAGNAFKSCSNLTYVEFCDKIEEFVTCEAMRGWWNHGVHQRSLSTYCFLLRC
jgi:hypothetical protein